LLLVGAALSLYAAGGLPGAKPATKTETDRQIGGFPNPAGPIGNLGKGGVVSVRSYKNDMSPPLREMAVFSNVSNALDSLNSYEIKENPKTNLFHLDAPDGALEDSSASALALASPNMPATTLNFDGIPFPGVVCNCAPPDPNGAVGL